MEDITIHVTSDSGLEDGKVYSAFDGKFYRYIARGAKFIEVPSDDYVLPEDLCEVQSSSQAGLPPAPDSQNYIDEEAEMDALLVEEPAGSGESHAMRSFWSTPVDMPEAGDLTELLAKSVTGPVFRPKFNHPGRKKVLVWEELGEKFKALGYPIPSTGPKDAGIKAKTKWNNLIKMKNKHSKKIEQTGSKRKTVPKYYDLMVEVTRNMQHHNPTHLLDSHPYTPSTSDTLAASSQQSLAPASPVTTNSNTTSVSLGSVSSSQQSPTSPLTSFSNATPVRSRTSSDSSTSTSSSSSTTFFSKTKKSCRPENRVSVVVQQLQLSDTRAEERHNTRVALMKEHHTAMSKHFAEELQIKRELLAIFKSRQGGSTSVPQAEPSVNDTGSSDSCNRR